MKPINVIPRFLIDDVSGNCIPEVSRIPSIVTLIVFVDILRTTFLHNLSA
jgi:hypothetical protein